MRQYFSGNRGLVFRAVIFIIIVVMGTCLIVMVKNRGYRLISVETDCGVVTGRKAQYDTIDGEREICYEFMNIPYAVPPVDELRWKPPILMNSKDDNCWTGDYYTATEYHKKMCMQYVQDFTDPTGYKIVGSEDCLYLSVRSPNLRGKLPVLVWIHGGSLEGGYNDDEGYSTDPEFATAMNVVAVNINYRLAMFGFLTLEALWETGANETEDHSYSSYGFRDMITSLQWIQNNIAAFGGDPTQVTVMGQSSGATSVYVLLSSPLAAGLFHKAIAVSGPALTRVNHTEGSNIHHDYLTLLGCDHDSFQAVRECLYNLSAPEIMAHQKWTPEEAFRLPKPDEKSLFLWLIKDPVVMPIAPIQLSEINLNISQNIPILLGSTAQEVEVMGMMEKLQTHEWDKLVGRLQEYLTSLNQTQLNKIKSLYFPDTNDKKLTPQLVWDTIVSDIRVTCPVNKLASGFSKSENHTTYRFYITHTPSQKVTSEFGIGSRSFHFWETWALFNFKKLVNFEPSIADLEFRDMMRSLYKDFIHRGEVFKGWERVPRMSAVFMNEQPGVQYLSGDVQSEQCRFWSENGFDRYGWHN